jgi:carboxylesterase type B
MILAFEEDFRAQFSELNTYFEALDKLGGRSCKSCDKNRQKLILRDMYNTTVTSGLTDRYTEYYKVKVSSGGIYATKKISTGTNANYAKMPLSLDQFIMCLWFSEVRELLFRKLESEAETLVQAVFSKGVYSKETKEAAKKIYSSLFLDPLFSEFSALINKLDIMDRVRANPNPLKVKILTAQLNLEEEINRFILGKNIISIQMDGLSALVTYR